VHAGRLPAPAERVERLLVRRIARRLELDAEQRRSLERIASETGSRMEEVRRSAVSRVDEILERAYDELEPTLRPDQRERLRELRQETRARFPGRNFPGGGGRREGRGGSGPPEGAAPGSR
jgi:predicted nuclease with TOPRIM domain